MSLTWYSSKCQFSDDFDDGDFQNNPAWSGDVEEFIVVDGQLRSNGPEGNGVLYLSTGSTAINEAVWEFSITLGFTPSNTNRVRVYLASDQSNLESSLNGYFIEIGQSGDDHIRFFRQDGETEELIFTGSSLISGGTFWLRITRNDSGQWQIYSDMLGGDSFITEGPPFEDNLYQSSAFFGIVCVHSSTRRDLFYFDNFRVTGEAFMDGESPTLAALEVISNDSLILLFSELIQEASAQVESNFTVDNGIGTPVSATLLSDGRSVALQFSNTFNEAVTYEIKIEGVEDLSGNSISSLYQSFEFIPLSEATPLDIVINEFLASPAVASGLPNAEFIELFNRSTKNINLENWIIADRATTSNVLDTYILRSGSYLILTEQGNGQYFDSFGDVLEITGFPTLNNSEDDLLIIDQFGQTIFSLTYTNANPGISDELINPNDQCISQDSYANSISSNGGTPGEINSVFDDTPDTIPPIVSSILFTNFLVVTFSEIMDVNRLLDRMNYTSNQLPIEEVRVEGAFPKSVILFFSEDPIEGEPYEMSIQGLTDCSGIEIEAIAFTFGIGKHPTFNELIITEILFDELPAVMLPEREYIELYNTTNKIIATDGLMLTDATGSVLLPAVNLEPHSYYVLTSSAGVKEFNSNAIGVSGFPSLNNAGELLTISFDGELISSIEYDPAWQESEKSAGGYSLELVDLNNACLEKWSELAKFYRSIRGDPRTSQLDK